MSGGTFEYIQYRITEAADEMKDLIKNNGLGKVKGEYDDKYYPGLSKEALEYMIVCEKYVRLAANLVHHADYIYASDTGDETFVKDIKEAFKNAGVPDPLEKDLG